MLHLLLVDQRPNLASRLAGRKGASPLRIIPRSAKARPSTSSRAEKGCEEAHVDSHGLLYREVPESD